MPPKGLLPNAKKSRSELCSEPVRCEVADSAKPVFSLGGVSAGAGVGAPPPLGVVMGVVFGVGMGVVLGVVFCVAAAFIMELRSRRSSRRIRASGESASPLPGLPL